MSIRGGVISQLMNLPLSMQDVRFEAFVEQKQKSDGSWVQKWTRVFGEGRSDAKKYSTFMRACPNFDSSKTGLTLTESLSTSILGDILRFGYETAVTDHGISYKSVGLWLWNVKIPLPRMLLPQSEWVETPT